MHALKLSLILLLLIVALRLFSWAIGWAVARLTHWGPGGRALLANALGCAGFIALLIGNLMPGEPLGMDEVAFAAIVFTVFAIVDYRWPVWRRERARP